MSRLEVDRRGPAGFHRRFPTGDTDAPLVPRLESGESPLRNGCDQIVAVQYRKIEKLTGYFHADSVESDIFRSGATESVAVKSGNWIAAAALQFGAKDVGGHCQALN